MRAGRTGLMLTCVLTLAACGGDSEAADADAAPAAATMGSAPAPGEPDLAAIRAATERFQDVTVAVAEGYMPDPSGMCVTAEMEGRAAAEGAMGLHYLRPDLLGLAGPPNPRVDGTSTHIDFTRPSVLIYEPQADGKLELVAVENLVFQKSWEAAGNTAPPSLHGVPYDAMMDDPATPTDEAHGFEPHFDRHVWIYRENPAGVFAPFNPNVTCAHAAHKAMN